MILKKISFYLFHIISAYTKCIYLKLHLFILKVLWTKINNRVQKQILITTTAPLYIESFMFNGGVGPEMFPMFGSVVTVRTGKLRSQSTFVAKMILQTLEVFVLAYTVRARVTCKGKIFCFKCHKKEKVLPKIRF